MFLYRICKRTSAGTSMTGRHNLNGLPAGTRVIESHSRQSRPLPSPPPGGERHTERHSTARVDRGWVGCAVAFPIHNSARSCLRAPAKTCRLPPTREDQPRVLTRGTAVRLSPSLGVQMEGAMTSVRVRHTLRVLCCLIILTAHPLGSAAQGVADVEASARKGSFQQAFVQSRAVVVVAPSLDGITQLRAVFAKYPKIQEAGVSMTGSLIDAMQTEQDLLGAQSELRYFVKLVNYMICDPGALTALQTRFVDAASKLVLDTGIPVTFESDLLADWSVAAGSHLDRALERRIYRNTIANIAARDARDTPSEMMTDRLFRFLLREPEAREEAFSTLQRVRWEARDLDGPMRYVYPDLVKQRRQELGMPELSTAAPAEPRQFDSSSQSKWKLPESMGTDQSGSAISFNPKGVEFGPWIRRFIAQIKKNWFIPYAEMFQKGHVSVSFNVHKDGTITDIVVAGPCKVDALNTSSYKAIAASNPTVPLPPEYPEEKAFFTVTFYYHETPPQK